MKDKIHPQYFEDATITCACGQVYKTGSTKEAISVELCAACHPFYTGKQTILDTARRVEKFTERAGKKATEVKGRAEKRAVRAEKRKAAGPKAEMEESKNIRVKKAKAEK